MASAKVSLKTVRCGVSGSAHNCQCHRTEQRVFGGSNVDRSAQQDKQETVGGADAELKSAQANDMGCRVCVCVRVGGCVFARLKNPTQPQSAVCVSCHTIRNLSKYKQKQTVSGAALAATH